MTTSKPRDPSAKSSARLRGKFHPRLFGFERCNPERDPWKFKGVDLEIPESLFRPRLLTRPDSFARRRPGAYRDSDRRGPAKFRDSQRKQKFFRFPKYRKTSDILNIFCAALARRHFTKKVAEKIVGKHLSTLVLLTRN